MNLFLLSVKGPGISYLTKKVKTLFLRTNVLRVVEIQLTLKL